MLPPPGSTCVIYNLITVIGRAVFWHLQNDYLVEWTVADYVADAVYLVDMFISSRTGFLEQGLLVRNVTRLYLNYFRSWSFWLDLASVLPTDVVYLYRGLHCDPERHYPCAVIFRLNRLLRFYRISEYFERTETRTNYPYIFRISKLIFYILVLIHWNACIYFAISYFIGFDSDRWVYNRKRVLVANETMDTFRHQYIYCFYWSTLTLTTIGEVPVPETDFEYTFVVINFLIGGCG